MPVGALVEAFAPDGTKCGEFTVSTAGSYGVLPCYRSPDGVPGAHPGETISALLERLGIDRETLYTVFLNGGLLATRNRMAPWLRYPQAQADVWDWENDAVLRPGDRLGLFGEDMASLVV